MICTVGIRGAGAYKDMKTCLHLIFRNGFFSSFQEKTKILKSDKNELKEKVSVLTRFQRPQAPVINSS